MQQLRSLSDHPVEIREEGGTRRIAGYAAVFNSLSHNLGGYREKIHPTAFDRSLREVQDGKRTVSARVQHDGGLSTVGSTANGSLLLSRDAKGLKYEIVAPPDTSAGRDIVTLVAGGYINKSSFAFSLPDPTSNMRWDFTTNPPTREILDLDLIDVAPVDGPAYEATSVEARALALQQIQAVKPATGRSRVEVFTRENGGKHVEVYLLDEIVPTWVSRYLPDTMSSGKLQEQLAAVPDAERIDVFINSPGGDAFEGVSIYNILKDHPAPVNVFVRGLAASAAAIVAMAGDNIQMGTGTFMMIHKAWTIALGNANQLRNQAAVLDTIDGGLADILSARSKNERKQVDKWMRDETWFGASEAVASGFADRVYGDTEPIDGERCRAIGYRNIPRELGGPGAPVLRSLASIEDWEAANNAAMKRIV